MFSSLVVLSKFKVFNSYVWLVVTTLNNSDLEYFLHCRKLYWTVLHLILFPVLTASTWNS